MGWGGCHRHTTNGDKNWRCVQSLVASASTGHQADGRKVRFLQSPSSTIQCQGARGLHKFSFGVDKCKAVGNALGDIYSHTKRTALAATLEWLVPMPEADFFILDLYLRLIPP